MKFTFLSIILISLIFIEACSYNKFALYEDDSKCDTVIEGYYASSKIWNTFYPAFISKKGIFKRAAELSRDSNGVYFKEISTRIFQTPDTLFYAYDDLQVIIDSTKKCTFGDIPNRFFYKGIDITLYLSYPDDPKYKPLYIELEPNEKFSYCVRPGKYIIDKIEFKIKDNIDQSYKIPKISFNVDANKRNYLGSIRLVDNEKDSADCLKIPYTNLVNSGESAGVGVMFGLIGTVIYQGIRAMNTDIDGYYYMKVENDSSFSNSTGKESMYNQLHRE